MNYKLRKNPLNRQNCFGSTFYTSFDKKYKIFCCDNLWYIKDENNKVIFDAGLSNIHAAESFINEIDSYNEQLSMLGYSQFDNPTSGITYLREDKPEGLEYSKISINSDYHNGDKLFTVDSMVNNLEEGDVVEDHFSTNIFNQLVDHIIQFLDKHKIDVFTNVVFADVDTDVDTVVASIQSRNKQYVKASITSRDITSKMVRVKSSNVWSIAIDIKDRKDKFATVYAQFKGNNGGPGDIYCYYDVPVKIYRSWVNSLSKGSFFWRYIRNAFKYSKLTGDKRGKLPNAVN